MLHAVAACCFSLIFVPDLYVPVPRMYTLLEVELERMTRIASHVVVENVPAVAGERGEPVREMYILLFICHPSIFARVYLRVRACLRACASLYFVDTMFGQLNIWCVVSIMSSSSRGDTTKKQRTLQLPDTVIGLGTKRFNTRLPNGPQSGPDQLSLMTVNM